MKKYLILASAAIVALAACNKETDIQNPESNNNSEEVVLTFTSERPQLDVDTKTAWDATNSCIVWEANDKIRVGYTLDGDWMGQEAAGTAKFYASKEVTIDDNDGSVGTFQVPITGNGVTAFTDPGTNGTYKFYAIYPSGILSNTTVDDPTAQSVTLATAQTPGANTFDHTTDIMVGASEGMSITGLPTDPIELNWNRVVAHLALTFSNMAFDGAETPSKITLTFNEAAKVAGTFSINITDGTIGAGTANEIALDGNGLTVNDTNISAWATVLPVSFSSLDVEVKTDKATYVRSITGLSKTFKKNARNTLTINMTTATRTASEQFDWVKKNLSEITSSDVFVIVGNNGSDYAMSNDKGASAAPGAIAVTVANNKLSVAPADKIQWNLAKDGINYTFYPNGTTATWLYCTSGTGNKVRVGTATTGNTFTLDDSGYLKNSDGNFLGVYNSQDWRVYSSTTTGNIAGQTFAFYVKSAATPSKPVPTISFGTPTTEVNIGETVTNVATIDPSSLAITYSSSDVNIATVSDAGVVTGVAAGKATITAAFAGDDTYDEASAEYEITVIDPNATANDGTLAHPYTASEARALALDGDEGSYYITGIVTKIQNQYSASYGTANFWIDEKGTSQSVFEAYKIKYFGDETWVEGNAEIAVGDEVIIHGTLTVYTSGSNVTPETSSGYLVSLNGKTKGLTPGTLTATPDNNNKQITVTWGAATGTESAISYVVSCGTQTYNANAAGSHTFTMADYGIYNVSVDASADDAISAKITKSISLSDPTVTEKTYTIQWGSAYNSASVSSYTASWSATYGGFTCNMVNWNNNNNGWNYVKAGRKDNASVATIITAAAIPEAIKTVILTIDAITTASVNSIKLYTSTDGTSWSEAGSFTKATGEQSIVISSPTTNKYYKVEADCASGSANGLIQVSKLIFTTN